MKISKVNPCITGIARSSFDPYIEQKTSSRVSGYYDGTNLTQRFSNPFEDFNGSECPFLTWYTTCLLNTGAIYLAFS